MKIISWNVNGLRSIEKKQALQWIDNSSIDIICLQETKLSDKYNCSSLFNKKFKSMTFNNSSKRGFSGTAIFSQKTPLFQFFCSYIDQESDGRIIEYRFQSISLLNVYIPNGKRSNERLLIKLQFLEKLSLYCTSLRKQNLSVIVCGDFNTAHRDIDLKSSKIYSKKGFSEKERDYLSNILENGYIDSFRYINGDIPNSYTLFPYRSKARKKNEGWRVDYIFLSDDLKHNLKDAFILSDILGSDHCPIGIELDL